jgi:hypothetical protein
MALPRACLAKHKNHVRFGALSVTFPIRVRIRLGHFAPEKEQTEVPRQSGICRTLAASVKAR